jgi:hypothetical protein
LSLSYSSTPLDSCSMSWCRSRPSCRSSSASSEPPSGPSSSLAAASAARSCLQQQRYMTERQGVRGVCQVTAVEQCGHCIAASAWPLIVTGSSQGSTFLPATAATHDRNKPQGRVTWASMLCS